ncbi:hypothetical protein [Devosia sp. A449]
MSERFTDPASPPPARPGRDQARGITMLGTALYIGVPALIACAAGLVFLLWVFGASATEGAGAHGWTLGFWALLGYVSLYQGLLLLLGLGKLARLPVSEPIHRVIWTATIIFVAVMAYALRELGVFAG